MFVLTDLGRGINKIDIKYKTAMKVPLDKSHDFDGIWNSSNGKVYLTDESILYELEHNNQT